jgi:hypothetical protein
MARDGTTFGAAYQIVVITLILAFLLVALWMIIGLTREVREATAPAKPRPAAVAPQNGFTVPPPPF